MNEVVAHTLARNGVAIVPRVVDGHDLRRLRRTCDRFDQRHPDTVVTARGFTNDLFDWQQDTKLHAFALRSTVTDLIRQAIAPQRLVFLAYRLTVRSSGAIPPTPWHHDFDHWPVTCTSAYSIWLALDRETDATGAMSYVRRSHTATDPASVLSPGPSDDVFCAELEPGDALVFEPRVVHGRATASMSARPRRFLITRWVSADAVYHPTERTMSVAPGHMLQEGDLLTADPGHFPSLP